VILGAEFNAAVQEFWPARATRMEQFKAWLAKRRSEAQGEVEADPADPADPGAHRIPRRRGARRSDDGGPEGGSAGGAPAPVVTR
jgi:membrane protein